jgi:hypothetical protein
MVQQTQEILDSPGQVQIDNLVLISFRKQSYLNLTDYLVELNLYEDIFRETISGDIVLSDSRNLINAFGMVGEEYLSLTIRTPTMSSDRGISKIFKVHALKDKMYAKDGSTLIYKLSFMSLEMFQDVLNPIYKAFSGKPEEIVTAIYQDYLAVNRNIQISGETASDVKSPLTIFGETANTLKFVSPGWSAMKCIRWICANTLPANDKSANFLFWETTKGFYFGNFETILSNPSAASIGNYVYSSPSITTNDEEDIKTSKFMFNIRSLNVAKTYDQFENLTSGYIASRLVDIDIFNKKYENVDYDHGINFARYSHLEKEKPVPLFDQNTARNPITYLEVNFASPNLHTGVKNNFSERLKNIRGNRRSNFLELNNFQLELTIPGRTDIEAGQTIYIKFPKKQPGALTSQDKNSEVYDNLYSGYYLITHINHKINSRTHYVTMNVTKDSLSFKAMEE